MDEIILESLNRIEQLIINQGINMKDILNIDELQEYTGYQKSYLYKLTSSREIPFYKPSGKRLFFRKPEIDEWLLRNRNTTNAEVEEAAQNFILKPKR